MSWRILMNLISECVFVNTCICILCCYCWRGTHVYYYYYYYCMFTIGGIQSPCV